MLKVRRNEEKGACSNPYMYGMRKEKEERGIAPIYKWHR
jgi:hypothetical protein